MNQKEIVEERLKDGIRGTLINSSVSDRIYFYPDTGKFSMSITIKNINKVEK